MNSWIELFVVLCVLINLTFAFSYETLAPEICDNGLDDDLDGLIDLNDDDCYCEPLEQPSLIPNSSFEDQECCPEGHSNLACATGWVQASEGTTDYFHACNYDGTDIFDLPQPIPDGEGFIGLIDGSFTGSFIPALKEYAGACLEAPTIPDTQYRLEFYTGFLDRQTSPDIEIALFGTTDCTNLPFGIGDKSFGCPANSPDWVRLGSVFISGENQWKKSLFKFRTSLELKAIAIGPGCALRSSTNNTYHFLDQIVLKENSNFDLGIQAKGQPCTNDLVFEMRLLEGYNYQWYKDGVAIPQAIGNRLSNPPGPGQYQVRLEDSEGCKLSEIYKYVAPSQYIETTETICAGEAFDFNNHSISQAGIYWDTLKTVNYCDSIVRLELLVEDAVETDITAKIFPGESFQIGTDRITAPGAHMRTVSSVSGCDSTIHLQLTYYTLYIPDAFSPNDDYINDVFSFYGGGELQEISSLRIFNRWGGLMYQGETLETNQGWDGTVKGVDAPSGVYLYSANLIMIDGRKKALHGLVNLLR